MALVIEDGTLVANANSFVTRQEIIDYAAARGITIPDADASDVFAINAMDFLWASCLQGDLVEATQGTPYPRSGLLEGDTVEDYVYSIPLNVKRAQLQLALDSFNGIELTPSAAEAAQLKRSKVGPIEEEFFAPGGVFGTDPRLTIALAYLGPFLCDDGGFSLVTVRA